MEIVDWSLVELTRRLSRGEVSAAEVTGAYLAQQDHVGAYIMRCQNAFEQAQEADRKRRQGQVRPLCGVPLAVKDNICTQGVPTTCASRMLEGFVPPYNATVWERLRQAGCILLGKTNMDEFAMGSSTETSAFHITRNPIDPGLVPGGSSGGSAACVAARLAPAALGSDTGGSIRQPSSFCGVVGLRPTYGLVSRYGLVAFASSMDCIGPMTRTVSDNALLLNAIMGRDPLDATTVDGEEVTAEGDVSGMKIGVPAELMKGVSAEVRQAVERAAECLETQGADVMEVSLPHVEHSAQAYYAITSAEASSNLARYDGVRYGHRAEECTDLEELYHRSRSEGFGQEVQWRILLGAYVLSDGQKGKYLDRARNVRQQVKQDFHQAFQQCDVLLSPVTASTAWKLGSKFSFTEMYTTDHYTIPASLAGIPALSLPWSQAENGLPLAVQLMAPAFGESLVYRVGRALEVMHHD